MARRTERVSNLIRNTIGQLLLSKLSDPRIDPAKTSITRVEVAEDLLTAKVFVTVIGTEGEQRNTIRALEHAAGHLQELMMRQIQLRHTPILQFVLDKNFKKTLQTLDLIDRAMAEIRQKEQSGAPDAEQPVETDSSSEQ
ncbi:MAG: 30S ribosome-binding factor RbfA [Planctomycetota bacterium]